MIKRFRELFERYERRASALAIIVGLMIDAFTLHRIDLYLTNFLLVFYLVLAAFSIALLNLHHAGRARWVTEGVHFALLVAMQFGFGGLFGRFLVYYSRAGAIAASWPFLLILAVLLVGNEFARKYYTQFVLQVSILFLATVSFLIFFVPIIIGRIGADVFVLSGVLSVGLIAIFVWLLRYLAPVRVDPSLRALIPSVGLIFFAVNFLYFTNIIPPIPLSLSSAGVYHSLVRTPSGYQVTSEKNRWYDIFTLYDIIHLTPGSPLYAYSAVFAPTDFGAVVVHSWQKYDEKLEEWTDAGRIKFGIVGGRDGGYRGHSFKNTITPGFWRVNIETADGQLIGRIRLKVETAQTTPVLVIENL